MYNIIACWGHSDVKIYNIKQDRYIIYHQFTIWYRMPLSVHSIQYIQRKTSFIINIGGQGLLYSCPIFYIS